MSAENTPLGSRGEEEPLPAHDQADIDAMNAEGQGVPMNSIAFENFPHQGTAVAMRQVIFGPATSEVALLITVDPHEGRVDIVLGNGPINEEAPQGVIELIISISSMLQDPEFVEQWAAEIDRIRQAEESGEPEVATEPVSPSDLIENDDQEV